MPDEALDEEMLEDNEMSDGETVEDEFHPSEGEYWQCICGSCFNDPRELAGHFFSSRQRSDGREHRPLGFVDVASGEVKTKWGPHVYHGKVRSRRPKPGFIKTTVDSMEDEEPTDQDELVESPKKGSKKAQVKVQYRPRVFDIDEGIIHLYHLTTSSIREKGVPYYPTEGEWIRESVFRFWMEHQELVDLRTIFTQEEREAILSVIAE